MPGWQFNRKVACQSYDLVVMFCAINEFLFKKCIFIFYRIVSLEALLEREHPVVGVEGEGEVVLHAEAEEDVLQCRAPRLVRLGEGNLEIVNIKAVFGYFPTIPYEISCLLVFVKMTPT